MRISAKELLNRKVIIEPWKVIIGLRKVIIAKQKLLIDASQVIIAKQKLLIGF